MNPMNARAAGRDDAAPDVRRECGEANVVAASVSVAASASAGRREIAFLDSASPDLDALVDVLGHTCDVVVLRAAGDGLAQMADVLSARDAMDAIHVLAHGAPGDDVRLGSTAMDDEVLARFGRRLHANGHGLSERGRLLLYRVFRRS